MINGPSQYNKHLRDAHGVTISEQRQLQFPPIAEKMVDMFVQSRSPIEGCAPNNIFAAFSIFESG